MPGYYENMGDIEEFLPPDDGGYIRLPASTIDAVPYRLRNIPIGQIAFVNRRTAFRDSTTDIVMLDTQDFALALPATEWELRMRPAVMRVLGENAVDGFIVDCRHLAHFQREGTTLSEGPADPDFLERQQALATVFPVGVITNDAGLIRARVKPEFQAEAVAMARRVDEFVASKWPSMPKYEYLLEEKPVSADETIVTVPRQPDAPPKKGRSLVRLGLTKKH